jgi:hypothetical protein
MGWRFRKSVKIAPGVRLNFTTRGLSATLGPGGASINVSKRGTYVNQSIPLLGLRRRIRVSGSRAAQSASNARSAAWAESPTTESTPSLPPAAKAWWAPHKAWQEQQASMSAAAPPSGPSAVGGEPGGSAVPIAVDGDRLLDAARGALLQGRFREPTLWEERRRDPGPYSPRPFTSPLDPTVASQRQAVVNALVPWTGWAVLLVIAGTLLMFAATGGGKGWGVLLLLVGVGRLGWDWRQRQVGLAELTAADAELETAMREAHEALQADVAIAHESDRALSQRLASTEGTEDTAALAELLELELANEMLPVPLEFELAFDGPECVGLEIALPPLALLPTTEPATTPGGKPTRKALSTRRRVELYRDLLAGLALRLVYETLRVLPMVQQVTCWGRGMARDSASGQEISVVALHLHVARQVLERIDLDHVDPSTCLESLGGSLGVAPSGDLRVLPDVGSLATHEDGTHDVS